MRRLKYARVVFVSSAWPAQEVDSTQTDLERPEEVFLAEINRKAHQKTRKQNAITLTRLLSEKFCSCQHQFAHHCFILEFRSFPFYWRTMSRVKPLEESNLDCFRVERPLVFFSATLESSLEMFEDISLRIHTFFFGTTRINLNLLLDWWIWGFYWLHVWNPLEFFQYFLMLKFAMYQNPWFIAHVLYNEKLYLYDIRIYFNIEHDSFKK